MGIANDELRQLQKALTANEGWLPGFGGATNVAEPDTEGEMSELGAGEARTFNDFAAMLALADDDDDSAPFGLSHAMGSVLADDDDDSAPFGLSHAMGSVLADDDDDSAPFGLSHAMGSVLADDDDDSAPFGLSHAMGSVLADDDDPENANLEAATEGPAIDFESNVGDAPDDGEHDGGE